MKIQQFSFSLEHDIATQRIKNSSNKKTPTQTAHANRTFHCSPHIKNTSNKRLKFYSNRNKEPTNTIDQGNIEQFQKEFLKFQDVNANQFLNTHKSDIFNLIVKKYSKTNKFNNIKKQINPRKKESQRNHLWNWNQKKKQKDPKERKDKVNSYKHRHLTAKEKIYQNLLNQIDSSLKRNLNLKSQSKDRKQRNYSYRTLVIERQADKFSQFQEEKSVELNEICTQLKGEQKNNNICFDQETRHQFDDNNFVQSHRPTASKRRVLVKEERLKRHIFNKSVLENCQKSHKFMQSSNPQHFMDYFQPTPLRQSSFNTIDPTSIKRQKASKRYININDQSNDQNETISISHQPSINPYTHKQYLHIKNRLQQKHMKSIQKYIKSSYSSNMIKSIRVKSISFDNMDFQKLNSTKNQKKSSCKIKEEFLKKIKNLKNAENINKEKQKQSNKKFKHIEDEKNLIIDGWDNGFGNEKYNAQEEEMGIIK